MATASLLTEPTPILEMGTSSIGKAPADPEKVKKNKRLVLAAGRGVYPVVRRLLQEKGEVDIEARYPPPLGILNHGKGQVTQLAEAKEATEKTGTTERTGETENTEATEVTYGASWVSSNTIDLTRTALQAAADGGYEEIVQLLIDKGANVNALAAESFGRTALQAAADGGHGKVVKLLIDAGADVNAPAVQYYGMTALQAAAWGGYEEIVKLLIEKDADVNAPAASMYGITALDAAKSHSAVFGSLEAARKRESSTAKRVGSGGSVLQRGDQQKGGQQKEDQEKKKKDDINKRLVSAAGKGDCTIVQELLQNEVEVDARSPPESMFNNNKMEGEKRTDGFYYFSERFLQHDNDVWSKEEDSMVFARTALQAASDGGHIEMVELLIEKGAEVNAPPAKHSGRTALQAAAEGGYKGLVELLIKNGAEVNAPPAEVNGRTALQAAAEGGYKEVVDLLEAKGASEGEEGSRPTINDKLVFLAGKGDGAAVHKLLRDKADINARCLPPFEGFNSNELKLEGFGGYQYLKVMSDKHRRKGQIYLARTALQAATEGGHKEIVELLIAYKADVNALTVERFGRTALQAAAEGGYKEVAKSLLKAGANVNAPPAREYGRTALQAAVEDGNEDLVKLFIKKGANVNAPRAEVCGIAPLQKAAEDLHEEVLVLLIDAGITLDKRNFYQGILHEACKVGDVSKLDLLLRLGKFDINVQDYSGSTPLHIATKEKKELALKLLLRKEGIDMEIKDNLGETPLQVALNAKDGDIFDLLLAGGASANGLKVEELCDLQRCRHLSSNKEDMITLLQGQLGGRMKHILRHSKWELKKDKINELRDWGSRKTPSICLLRSNEGSIEHDLFADPNTYLENNLLKPDKNPMIIDWTWLTVHESRRVTEESIKPVKGVPNNKDMFHWRSAKVILVGYVCFDVLVYQKITAQTGAEENKFELGNRKFEISWTMKQQDEISGGLNRPLLRSIHYRGRLDLKNISIPSHAVDFFILLLDNVRESWVDLFKNAKECLANMRSYQLDKGGRDPEIINGLLLYTQHWNEFQKGLVGHISKSNSLLDDLRKHDILRTELMGSGSKKEDSGKGGDKAVPKAIRESRDGIGGPNTTKKVKGSKATKETTRYEEDPEEPEAIKRLARRIKALDEKCKKEISYLEKETKDMIELEFNLVSIYEARRGISMSASMKRLSWITFIFLPLMFASGLFGMNVDILDGNPSWLWYIVVAVPIMILIVLVWILFKHVPISKWIKVKIGSRLELDPNKNSTTPTPSYEIPKASEKIGLSSPDFMGLKPSIEGRPHNRWFRRRHKGLDEESSVQPDSVVFGTNKESSGL